MQQQITQNIKDHIKEVMSLAYSTKRAQFVVPKTLLRYYMLELKLMGVQVTVENENELHINWTEEAILKERRSRRSSEELLRGAARLQGSKGDRDQHRVTPKRTLLDSDN